LAAVVIAAADQAGIKTTSFLAVFGAAGLAIGLALKDSLSNFASGVLLIILRPFKVGDVVNTVDVTGKVRQIDIFSTVLMTPDNQKIIVPNSLITKSVITNVNAEATRRIDIVVGVGYDDDLDKAKATLHDLLAAESRILTDPAPEVLLMELGPSSVDMTARFWVQTEDYWPTKVDLTEKIKQTFDTEGISFPFPQQDVHLYQHKVD
jgi:small conductance mechanosensitive channel